MANRHIIRKDTSILGGLIVNAEFADADVVINKITSGIAYSYDAGTDTHTFGSFPITPSSAPTTDYQVANKKYVDDNAGSYWQRVSTTLSPSNSGDGISIGAFTGAGTTIFNNSSIDVDFTIKKLTSGIAYAYDAGADTSTFNSEVLINSSGASIIPLTVKGTTDQSANLQQWTTVDDTVIATVGMAGLTLGTGASINLFDTDITLVGNSDSRVPTQKAIKAYVTSYGDGAYVPLSRTVNGKQLNANISLVGSDIAITASGFGRLLSTADNTVQKAFDRLDIHNHSVGMTDFGLITDNGDGTVDIASGDCYLYSVSDWTGLLVKYTIVARTDVALVDNSTNYIYVNYNSGSPMYLNTTIPSTINNSDKVLVAAVFRYGVTLTVLDGDFAKATSTRINNRLIQTERFLRAYGIVLTESATRHIDVSAGTVYYGCRYFNLLSVASDADTCQIYYHSSGDWVHSDVTQYNNTQWDDGTNLQTLGVGKYAVNWIYRFVENEKHIAFVLGEGNYDITSAKNSQPPALPAIISNLAILVGRIIVQKSSDTALQIDSAFQKIFNVQTAVNHNDLGDLQGGITSEYYHLTSQEYTDLHDTALITTGNFDIARMPVSGSWELTGNLEFVDDEVTPNSILFIDKTNRRVGVTQPVPLNLLHLYGTNNVADEFDNIPNMLQLDGVSDGDIGNTFAIAGVKKFDQYMYRGENGRYFYLWGQEAQNDLQIITEGGRYGWMQPSNYFDYHTRYLTVSGGALNDMKVGVDSPYTPGIPYNTVFQCKIFATGTPDTFKYRYSIDNGETWSGWSAEIECDTANILLRDGVEVNFGATIGHSTSDEWEFIAFSISPQGTFTVHPLYFKQVTTTVDYTQTTPTFVGVTSKSHEISETPYVILPIGTGDSNKGAFYFGANHKASGAYLYITTPAVNATIVFEIWNGTAWAEITGTDYLIDNTNNLTESGLIQFSGVLLTWEKYQLPGKDDNYNLYWVRVRSSTVMTTAPQITIIVPQGEKRFSIYACYFDKLPSFYVDAIGRTFVRHIDGYGDILNVVNSTVADHSIGFCVDENDVSITLTEGGATASHSTVLRYGELLFNTTGVDAEISHKYNRAIKFYKDTAGDNDLMLHLELDGTLSTGIANYETLVTSDNDIPNKKYVDSATSGGLQYQATWNANTNTPDITGATTVGYFWVVSTAGSTDLGGITTWNVGDWAVKITGGWSKIPAVTTTWGSITGTLSNQTDLQNALNDRVTDTELANWTGSSSIATVGTITSGTWTGSRIGTSYLDTTVTTQGNTFNGTSQLVQTTAAGYLPALNASLLTNIAWTSVSKTGSSLADLATRSASDLTTGNLAIARMPSVGGNWVCSSQVYLQNSLRSNSYTMGTGPDMSLQPVAGGQSAIQVWHGLILKGNMQSSVEATPTAIGTSSRASVLIPCQQTASIGLDIIRIASQTGDILRIDDENLTKLFSIEASGAISFATGASISLFDDDALFTADSASRLPTQKATKAYIGAFAGSSNITTLGTITTGTWNATAIAWNKVDKTGSSLADLATRTFTQLTDVPSSYSGQGLKVVRVNSGATALEFTSLSIVPISIARVTGTVTSTTTSFADVTGLTFAVLANTSYLFEFDVIYQSTAAGTGIAFAVNGPASPTTVQVFTQIMSTVSVQTVGNANAYDTGVATASTTANTNLRARISCIFDNGANAGTLALRFASETGTAVSARVGSVGKQFQTT